jgi:hypothetical protein
MNDKEVKEFMLQAYRMGDAELRCMLILVHLLFCAVPACFLLIVCLAIFCPKQETKHVTHPVQQPTMELEKSR